MIPPAVYQGLAVVPGLRQGRSGARETEPVEPVDDAVVEATLPHLSEVIADMVRLERLTGMRPAEVCLIRPCDVDQSGNVWVYKPHSHKTEHHGKSRTVYLGPKAQSILQKYLARDLQSFCFSPVDSEAQRRAAAHRARLTPLNQGNVPGSNRKHAAKSTPGERYTTDTYRRAIWRACYKAFPHPSLRAVRASSMTPQQADELRRWHKEHRWSPNQLRHTAGTEIRRAFGLEAAQVFLGHSTADVTQIYAERDAAKGFDVASRIG
jgi:integrase